MKRKAPIHSSETSQQSTSNSKVELIQANKELAFQNQEKQDRAAELAIANQELAFQNSEKEKRAAELLIANSELLFQNQEKENRAAELSIANKELRFQNNEKEKRAVELQAANKELEAFTFISSHDLQEPLRKIQTFSSRILAEEYENLSDKGKYYFERMQISALHMQNLINDLLVYSKTTQTERKFAETNLETLIKEATAALKEELEEKKATVTLEKATNCTTVEVIVFQFRQLLQNLITNSLKFANPEIPPAITIQYSYTNNENSPDKHLLHDTEYCHITYSDNGIGFSPEFNERIFELFQRLNDRKEYEGTGIGLTIVKKIVQNHYGIITASGQLGNGCTFDIFIPRHQK